MENIHPGACFLHIFRKFPTKKKTDTFTKNRHFFNKFCNVLQKNRDIKKFFWGFLLQKQVQKQNAKKKPQKTGIGGV